MYRLFVDDNFHYQDESERYLKGTFDTAYEAIDAAKKIVDDFLMANRERCVTVLSKKRTKKHQTYDLPYPARHKQLVPNK